MSTQAPPSEQPTKPAPARRGGRLVPTRPGTGRRRSTIVQVLGALVTALGAGVVAHTAFGVSGPVPITVVVYLAFVAVMALAEWLKGAQRGPGIDLTLEEQAGARVEPPKPELHMVREEDAPDVPMRKRRVTAADVAEMGVAALGAVAVAELVRIVLHMSSLVGFVFWAYVAFVAIYFVLVRDRRDIEGAVDSVVTLLVVSAGLLVGAVLVWMIVFISAKGAPHLAWSFFTQDMSKVGPLTPGGGAKHSIIGTLEQVGIATFIVVPVGILTAVYLHEINGRLARPVRFIVDAMAGVPSIVAGLLIFTIWVDGRGYSGIAGSLALVILMLPTMTRASEEILRTVPDTLREGALALGSPHWRLVVRVVLPTALTGLVTASLLAVARAIGETAPMILTALGTDGTNVNPLKNPQSDLPLFVFKLWKEGQANVAQLQRSYTGAFVLVMLVFILFVSARLIAGRGARKLGRAR